MIKQSENQINICLNNFNIKFIQIKSYGLDIAITAILKFTKNSALVSQNTSKSNKKQFKIYVSVKQNMKFYEIQFLKQKTHKICVTEGNIQKESEDSE